MLRFMESDLCQLAAAAGRSERCPGDRCPFWNDEQCVVAPLRADFAQNACLVALLVGLRAKLAREEPGRGFREFHPPGLA
jgi:hypothetical protein